MWLSSILAQNWSLSKSKLDLWKPGLNKKKKKNERETQPKRTSPFSHFFAKVVARQAKGKMIVDGVNIASTMLHVGDIVSTVGVFSTVGYSNNKRFPPPPQY